MAVIRPFAGLRFAPKRAPLSRVLCPPYDVISPAQARSLRRERFNAIHLELPEGRGMVKYRNAARKWKKWVKSGILVRDSEPAFYVCEEIFKAGGKTCRRLGFLAGMGLGPSAAGDVIPHERTLSKPKADRLRVLKAVGVNISPIFGLFEDPGAGVRRVLAQAARRQPLAAGRMGSGTRYRLWNLNDPSEIEKVCRSLKRRKILIADGHHRYAVGRRYWRSLKVKKGAGAILAYLCADEDPGVVTMGYHRVLPGVKLLERARRLCRMTRCGSLKKLDARLARSPNPCAFGLYEGGFYLAEPRDIGGSGRFGVKWIGDRLFAGLGPESIVYTHDAPEAAALARREKGTAVIVRAVSVAEIRRAVATIGLLPQKSSYFFPKVATGLVFKPVRGA